MAVQTVSVNTNVDAIAGGAWNSMDTLVISGGATATVNTDQQKYWNIVNITDGTLLITNNSTTSGLAFTMGRNTGTTQPAITPANGLGRIIISGNWIDIGTSSGTANQVFTIPYNDYVAALWVETSGNSNIYKPWINILGDHTNEDVYKHTRMEPYAYARSGVLGDFFIQNPNSGLINDMRLIVPNCTLVSGSRSVTCTSTSDIFAGANVSGLNIPLNTVVNRVINATTFEMHVAATNSGTIIVSGYNPYRAQLLNSVKFGDNINGNIPPSGSKIRIPNIMITDLTPAHIQTSSAVLGGGMVMTNGGILYAENCLFDESYNNLTQSQSIYIKNTAFSLAPLVAECYNFKWYDSVLGLPPIRRYNASLLWATRNNKQWNISWSYISNCIVSGLYFATYNCSAMAGAAAALTAPSVCVYLSYTNNGTFKNIYGYNLFSPKANQFLFGTTAQVNNSLFENLYLYGAGAMSLSYSNNNIINNIITNNNIYDYKTDLVNATSRIINDPTTGKELVMNQEYFLKIRSYRTWSNPDDYYEGRLYSFTPYQACCKFHPKYFGVCPVASGSNVLNWVRQDPSATDSVDIYRLTNSGDISRNESTHLFRALTVATVTATDTGGLLTKPLPGSGYYYVLRKYNARVSIGGCSGVIGQNIINTTSSTNFYSGWASIAATHLTSGSNILRTVGINYSFDSIVSGMLVNGSGIPSGTYALESPRFNELIISNPVTMTTVTRTQYGLVAGMAISGNGIASGILITSIDSPTQITVSSPHVSTFPNNTLYFATFSESAPQYCLTQPVIRNKENRLTQWYDFTNANWTKTNITPTANTVTGPHDNITGTATTSADTLLCTANSGSIMQAASCQSNTEYNFSIYAKNNGNVNIPIVSGFIQLGSTKNNIEIGRYWKRYKAIYTTGASETLPTGVFGILNSGAIVFAAGAGVASGSIETGPGTITGIISGQYGTFTNEITGIYVRPAIPGIKTNSDFATTTTAFPSGTHTSDMFIGTSANFTPSIYNKIASFWTTSAPNINLYFSNDNRFMGISGYGYAGNAQQMIYMQSSKGNEFANLYYDFNYGGLGLLATAFNLCNDTLIHNADTIHTRTYDSSSVHVATVNNEQNITLQNIRSDCAMLGTSHQGLNVVTKGISSNNSSNGGSTAYWNLGSTSDGVNTAYTAVYDTIFHEYYHDDTYGSLYITFNASQKEPMPYIISGSAYFSNTGRLYFKNGGDSITYTWPHRIYGVKSFRNIYPFLNGNSLGTDNQTLYGLKLEYDIEYSGGYTGIWKDLRNPSLISSESGWTPSTGFGLKIRMTCQTGMKYGTLNTRFIPGEIVKGNTSGAIGTVVSDLLSTNLLGTVILSNISGTFSLTEQIRTQDLVTTRANNVATVSTAIFPNETSYIDGFRLETEIDKTVLYPIARPTLTLTGLEPFTRIEVLKVSDNSVLAETINASGTFTTQYDYYSDVEVKIVIASLGYQNIYLTGITLTRNGLEIPVQQQYDRQYLNPV